MKIFSWRSIESPPEQAREILWRHTVLSGDVVNRETNLRVTSFDDLDSSAHMRGTSFVVGQCEQIISRRDVDRWCSGFSRVGDAVI